MKWENAELKFISLVAIAILILDIFSTHGLLFIFSILNLALVAIGLIPLFKRDFRFSINYLVIGYCVALLLNGIEGFFIRSYRPSLSSLYFINCLLFACAAIYVQQIYRTPNELSNHIYRIFFFRLKLTNRYRKAFAVVVSIILVALLSIGFYPEISCSVNGGKYTIGGLIRAEYCLYKYSDGTKTCSSSTECEGDCVLDETTLSVDNAIHGVCESNSDPYGCHFYVENGKVVGGACSV